MAEIREVRLRHVERSGWIQTDLRLAGVLEDLQDLMVSDPDAQVVANCMSVLQQVRPQTKLLG